MSMRLPPSAGNEQSHIVFVIERVSARHMAYLLDYMYTGEVNVPAEDLAGVLKAAEELQVTGLYSSFRNGGGDQQNGETGSDESEEINQAPPAAQASRPPPVEAESKAEDGATPSTSSAHKTPAAKKEYLPNPQASTSRPSSGGSSGSSSVKTGSGMNCLS